MYNEFVKKYQNNEYISNYLYQQIICNHKELIPPGFNIDEYNEKILDKQYIENKTYFENMYKNIDDNIQLDEEQCKAILADEKYSLIIAGAGTGKTTTMVSKVKYLVDKKNIDPKRILVMSYTRKATEEIANRIEQCIGKPVHVTTFHSLGYEYIRQIFAPRKCNIMDKNKQTEIFTKYFKKIFENKKNIEEIIENFEVIKEKKGFIFSKYFIENYKKYETYDDFIEAYIEYKIKEAKKLGINYYIESWVNKQLIKDEYIISIEGEYVKSAGEMIIANFLYENGLEYHYEETYEELMKNNSIYKPDFVVDYGGEKIYIEYFGLNDEKYNKIKNWKHEFHKKNNNKFISIDRKPLDKIIEELDYKLKQFGIVYKKRTKEEIYRHILSLNPISQVYPFINFLHECVLARKESFHRENLKLAKEYLETYDGEEKNKLEIQYKYIADYNNFYIDESFGGSIYYFDFTDLLYYSTKYIEKITKDTDLSFDYIIIDEYQDISQVKYELTYKTALRNDSKISAVGDDWQSIYAFSGSRIEYIYKFQEYFKGSKCFNISRTYRNSQELIDYSGKFIMKNENQIKKQLSSFKHIKNPVEFVNFDSSISPDEEIISLKKTILKIHKENPNHNILILARTNKLIDKILDDNELIDDVGTKITFKGKEEIQMDGMTMHKSKGLTYDEVIIVGLNNSFPSLKTETYWYKNLYKNKPFIENIPFAEERRLFYVALTRTKNKVYLVNDINPNKRSLFVEEIKNIIYKDC